MNDEESNLPANRLWQPTTARWFYVVLGSCVPYAVIICHIAGDVLWRHFPGFILNKKGWLKPQAWPAGMPSISLVAFVAAVIPLIVKRNLVYERRRKGLH